MRAVSCRKPCDHPTAPSSAYSRCRSSAFPLPRRSIRFSHAHAVVIATWRLFFALIIVGAALAYTGGWRQWRTLDRTGLLLAAGAGVLLALHFWAWNASIALTTIAASTVLVDLQPVIVAGASAAWLREAPSRRQWTGNPPRDRRRRHPRLRRLERLRAARE